MIVIMEVESHNDMSFGIDPVGVLAWIRDNHSWLFSGIGALVLLGIFKWLFRKGQLSCVLDLLKAVPKNILTRMRSGKGRAKYVSSELVEAAGLSAFYPSREYYRQRDGAESIDRYIQQAEKSLVIVSINLMTGIPFNSMMEAIRQKLEGNDYCASVSLLDPDCDYAMRAISPALNMTPEQLSDSIKRSTDALLKFRRTLSMPAALNLRLRLHDVVPFGSAILLDHKAPYGRIQVEMKAYMAPISKSFAFEVRRPYVPNDGALYDTLATAFELLTLNGRDMCEDSSLGGE